VIFSVFVVVLVRFLEFLFVLLGTRKPDFSTAEIFTTVRQPATGLSTQS
jgi:hypothetical protein